MAIYSYRGICYIGIDRCVGSSSSSGWGIMEGLGFERCYTIIAINVATDFDAGARF